MNNTITHIDNGDFEVVYTDYCVICNIDTNIPKSTNVLLRCHYVDGTGQMCEKCYIQIYNRVEIPIYEQTR